MYGDTLFRWFLRLTWRSWRGRWPPSWLVWPAWGGREWRWCWRGAGGGGRSAYRSAARPPPPSRWSTGWSDDAIWMKWWRNLVVNYDVFVTQTVSELQYIIPLLEQFAQNTLPRSPMNRPSRLKYSDSTEKQTKPWVTNFLKFDYCHGPKQ